MRIAKVTIAPNFASELQTLQSVQPIQTDTLKQKHKKDSFLDKIHEKTRNSSDMTDTIVVPRTIFKGYLGIMAGTTLATIGSFMTSGMPKMGKTLGITGLLTSLYGAWAFVRPFVLKDVPGVEHTK